MSSGDVYKLLEGADDAAFVIRSDDAGICFWNAAAERLFGYTSAEVLNRSCADVLNGQDALGSPVWAGEGSVPECARQTVPIPNFDFEATTSSGKRIWVSVSTIVFEDSRLHQRLIAHLAHDISGFKEMEQAFAKMVEASRQIVSIGDGEPRAAPVEALSDHETHILQLFAKAMNSGQVARELGITLPTLRNHLHAINQKLHTHNRLEAVLHAMKRGLI